MAGKETAGPIQYNQAKFCHSCGNALANDIHQGPAIFCHVCGMKAAHTSSTTMPIEVPHQLPYQNPPPHYSISSATLPPIPLANCPYDDNAQAAINEIVDSFLSTTGVEQKTSQQQLSQTGHGDYNLANLHIIDDVNMDAYLDGNKTNIDQQKPNLAMMLPDINTWNSEEGYSEYTKEKVVDTDEFGDTDLHRFIQGGQVEKALNEIERIMSSNDICFARKIFDQRNENKQVALHSAVTNPQMEKVIDRLLQHGADPTIQDQDGNNILHKIVLATEDESTALRLLRVVFKHKELYKSCFSTFLTDPKYSLNSKGYAVLHELVKKGFQEAIKYIHANGADLNIRDRREKKTSLVMASKRRNWNVVKLLVGLNACVNISTSSDWYPVHAAIEDSDEDMLIFFMQNGVDIYGYAKIESTAKIRKSCDSYMRKRRRNFPTSDQSTKRKRRCKCNSYQSQVHIC